MNFGLKLLGIKGVKRTRSNLMKNIAQGGLKLFINRKIMISVSYRKVATSLPIRIINDNSVLYNNTHPSPAIYTEKYKSMAQKHYC